MCMCVCMCVWLFRYARIVYGAVRVRGRKRIKKKRPRIDGFTAFTGPFRFLRSIAWSCTVAWNEKKKKKKKKRKKKQKEKKKGTGNAKVRLKSYRRKRKKNHGKRRVLIQPPGFEREFPSNTRYGMKVSTQEVVLSLKSIARSSFTYAELKVEHFHKRLNRLGI